MVSGMRQCEHITPVLEDLHWLPVSQRVVFKTALMVWKCVHGVAPAYLSDFCMPATTISGRHRLQSTATGTLLVSRARTATGQWSFAVNRPATWNHLPPALRSPDLSESAFKRALKTHLFSTARRHWDVFMILALHINIQTHLLNACYSCEVQISSSQPDSNCAVMRGPPCFSLCVFISSWQQPAIFSFRSNFLQPSRHRMVYR